MKKFLALYNQLIEANRLGFVPFLTRCESGLLTLRNHDTNTVVFSAATPKQATEYLEEAYSDARS